MQIRQFTYEGAVKGLCAFAATLPLVALAAAPMQAPRGMHERHGDPAQLAMMPLTPAVPLAGPVLPMPTLLPLASDALAPSAARAGLGAAMRDSALEGYRGGSDVVNNDARLSGLVGANAATNVSTGANTIDGASFSNVAGIPVVIQNSGANVLIQNSTIVNLQLK